MRSGSYRSAMNAQMNFVPLDVHISHTHTPNIHTHTPTHSHPQTHTHTTNQVANVKNCGNATTYGDTVDLEFLRSGIRPGQKFLRLRTFVKLFLHYDLPPSPFAPKNLRKLSTDPPIPSWQ